jgi:hypothetical protein
MTLLSFYKLSPDNQGVSTYTLSEKNFEKGFGRYVGYFCGPEVPLRFSNSYCLSSFYEYTR